MPGAGTEKHYAGRYICQKDACRCKGTVKRDGKRVPCPIAEKCRAGKDDRGQLEYFWPLGRYGKLLIKSTPTWDRDHTRRLNDLKNVFAKDEMRAYYKKYREKNKDKIEKAAREFKERQDKEKEKEVEQETGVEDRRDSMNSYGEGARHILFPCGEDCRNCPIPEGPSLCPYTDEDEDRLMGLEYGK